MKKKIIDYIRRLVGTKTLLKNADRDKKDLLFEIRKNQMIEHILHDSDRGVTENKYCNHDIIVSLTTHGKRIYDVAFSIESIMQQSMKANRIILWLDNSFRNQSLPESLVNQQKRGLEIAFCEDLGPYTKLIPSLHRYPSDAIITIDDDAIYDFDLLERLIIPYQSDPSNIYCFRIHKMKFEDNGTLLPYMKWDRHSTNSHSSHLNFATGVGGVLYPPHSLDEEVLDKETFLQICSTADDVWYKAMEIKRGTKVKKVYTRDPKCREFVLNASVQDVGLLNKNIKGEMLNDKQIHDVFSKYNIYSMIKDESV